MPARRPFQGGRAGFFSHIMKNPPALLLVLLSFLLPAAPLGAAVAGYASAERVSGPQGYRENTYDAGLFFRRSPAPKPKKIRGRGKKKSPPKPPIEKPRLVEGGWCFASRSAFGKAETVSWSGGAGLDFRKGFGADLSSWAMPGPKSPSDGSYRAQGMDAGFSTRWRGLVPFRRPYRRSLRTLLYVSGGWATHQAYFANAFDGNPPNHWFTTRQTHAGAYLTWTLFGSLSLGADGRLYAYDRDIRALAGSLTPLSDLGMVSTYDLVRGFPERTWGFKASQSLWTWGDLTLRWRRTGYVIGRAPRSDTASISLGVYFWRACGVRTRYEVSKPQGRKQLEYKGLALDVGF
jgi:hypothetical protein